METIVRILRGHAARHIYVVVAVMLALLLRVALAEHSITLPTYVTFYPVVFLAALLGGISEGILATTLSALLADYFLLEPVGSFAIHSTSDMVGMVIFCVSGVTVSVITGLYQRSREKRVASKIEAATLNDLGKTEKAAVLSEAVPIGRELDRAEDQSRLPALDQARFRALLRGTVAFPFIAASGQTHHSINEGRLGLRHRHSSPQQSCFSILLAR